MINGSLIRIDSAITVKITARSGTSHAPPKLLSFGSALLVWLSAAPHIPLG